MSYPIGKARYSISAPGSKMARVKWYVEHNPGLAMYHAAKYAAPGPSDRPGIAYGYATVHRALRAKLVIGKPGPRRSTLLYPVDAP